MNDLPTEAFYGIFHYLSRPEIHIFSLVCKKWNSLALKVYPKVLVIDDRKVSLAKMNLAGDNHSQLFRNGHLVRTLILRSQYGSTVEYYRRSSIQPPTKRSEIPISFSRSEFLLLLEYFPNVEEINLTASGNFMYYVSFLPYANLPHIKKITAMPFECYNDINDYYHEYFSTCFRFCGTLTSLWFQYTDSMNDCNYRSMDIIDILGQFKNLKQLVFHNKYRTELVLFRVYELCPQLTELTFTSNTSSPEMVAQGSLDQKIESTVKLNKRLRRLNISLSSLSMTFTRYLTAYLEDQLHTVDIQITVTGLYDWLNAVGMDVALELMRKLGQLNNVCISFLKNRRTRSEYLTSELKMTRWFQAVNAFRGNKKALCSVNFCETGSSQDYFRYNALDNRLRLDYGLENVDYHERGYGDHTRVFYGPLSEPALPIRSISTIGFEIFNHIELNLGRMADGFIIAFLRYVFRNCINLQYLKVAGYLQIQESPTKRSNHLNGTRNNLKMLHFLSGAPTYDLFKMVSTSLPDIEVLVFGSYSILGLELDLTLFKSLKRCYFIVQRDPRVRRSVTIKFEYTDGRKQRYYYDGKVRSFLVREDAHSTTPRGRSFTFTCEKDIEFTVCIGSDQILLEFDVNKPQGSCYRIPTYLI